MSERRDPTPEELAGSPETLSADYANSLALIRSMRTAAIADYGVDPQKVLTDAKFLAEITADRTVAQLFDGQDHDKLRDLRDKHRASLLQMTARYGQIPRTVANLSGIGDGGLLKARNLASSRITNPYYDLKDIESWNKTFLSGEAPEEGKTYLIFSPLSADYLEAVTLDKVYRRAYEIRNAEAERRTLSARKGYIPPHQIIPIAFSRDFSKFAHSPVSFTGNERALPYVDTSVYDVTLRNTQWAISAISPELFPVNYRRRVYRRP